MPAFQRQSTSVPLDRIGFDDARQIQERRLHGHFPLRAAEIKQSQDGAITILCRLPCLDDNVRIIDVEKPPLFAIQCAWESMALSWWVIALDSKDVASFQPMRLSATGSVEDALVTTYRN